MTYRRTLRSALLISAALAGIPLVHAADVSGTVKATVKELTGSTGNATIERVASFDHQVTGVAVSEDGRIFVNFPRWSEDAPISVGEWKDGKLVAYPDEEWNKYRNGAQLSTGEHFVCVQAMTTDGKGNLWILDPAAPNTEFIVPGGPKLVQVDLKTNQPVKIIRFAEDLAPVGSYLNDVRFSPDGQWAYMTDSGAQGALVVLDLKSGKGRRFLERDVSTTADKNLKVVFDGVELRQPDGRGVNFNADSITIDPKGEYLYWQPLTATVLYRIPTSALQKLDASDMEIKAKVEKVADTQPTDGLWTDKSGRIFFTDIQRSAITTREPDGSFTTLVQDPRLRWPDTFGQGGDGALYVTNSAINDSPKFNKGGWKSTSFNLWKIVPKRPDMVAGNPAFTR